MTRRTPATLRLVAEVGPRVRLMALTMLGFNAGFYLVLPYLAAHLTDDLGLGAAVVGTVLGVRMLCQQGLFVVGGALADRLGARRAVLSGIALRVLAFGLLGQVTAVPAVVAAVVLLGVAGALFTPAVEALVAEEADALARRDGPGRTEVFAVYAAGGQVGTLVGPALGSLLLLGGFRWCAWAAAGVFAAAYVVHARRLPRHHPDTARERPRWGVVLGNRRFLVFAAASGGYLAVYNQLYLAVPLELDRSGLPAALAGWLFTGSATLVVALQVRVSAELAPRLDPGRSVPLGFGLLAAGALAPALTTGGGPLPVAVGVALFVLLLTLGQMVLLPATRDAVATLAAGRLPATHYGVVGTAGGVAVLLVSAVVGRAFDAAAQPDGSVVPAGLPWLVLVAVALLGALGTGTALRGRSPEQAPGAADGPSAQPSAASRPRGRVASHRSIAAAGIGRANQ